MKNLKSTVLITILLVSVGTINAQTSSIDNAYILVKYNITSMLDTNNRTKITKDIMGLEISKTGSRYYSVYDEERAKEAAEFKKNPTKINMDEASLRNLLSKMGKPLKIYKDYLSGQTISIDRIASNWYNFKEDTPSFDWEILTDTSRIINQVCQKAVCKFKGREYEAWFAQEINVSEGPWKFNGLPGLILKISDSRKEYSFEAIAVEKIDYPIAPKLVNAQQVSKEKFLALYQQYIKDPIGFTFDGSGQKNPGFKAKDAFVPHNPIELTDK